MDKCRIVLLGVLMITFGFLQAQTTSTEPEKAQTNVIGLIEEGSEGDIVIDIDEYIVDLLMEKPVKVTKKEGVQLKKGVNRLPGYRIQVFADGNNPRTLRSRSESRRNAVASKFPKYRGQVYSYSKGPNWYTQVGNFRTYEEATSAMGELKRAFPSFANEMRVVKTEIVIYK